MMKIIGSGQDQGQVLEEQTIDLRLFNNGRIGLIVSMENAHRKAGGKMT